MRSVEENQKIIRKGCGNLFLYGGGVLLLLALAKLFGLF